MYLINLPEICRHAIFLKSATVCKNEIVLSKSGMLELTVLYWKSDKKKKCLCGFHDSGVDKWSQKVRVF